MKSLPPKAAPAPQKLQLVKTGLKAGLIRQPGVFRPPTVNKGGP